MKPWNTDGTPRILVSRATLNSLADQAIDAQCAIRDARATTDMVLRAELTAYAEGCAKLVCKLAAELLRHGTDCTEVAR